MTAALSSYLSNSKVSGRLGKAPGIKANAKRPPGPNESIVAPGSSDRLGEYQHVGSSCDEIRKLSLLVVRRDVPQALEALQDLDHDDEIDLHVPRPPT